MVLRSRVDTTLTFDDSFKHELARESWTMYALGMTFIGLRIYARVRRNGYRSLAPDDYLMLLAAAWYTVLIICLNVIAGGGGSNLYSPDEYDTFTQEEIKDRIKGSKIVVVSEQSMLNLIYTLKACMLFIYTRLTLQLRHKKFVDALAIYTGLGYFGTQLAFFLSCRPFVGYWAMPPPNPQCATLAHYAIAQACFNISSDAFMLAISLPLLLSTTLPLKQKVVLVAIFGMGLFVILAAILTKVYNLQDVYSTVYMLWYVRESSVAVWVTNLPLIWPLMREVFPVLRTFTPGQRAYSSSQSRSKLTRGKSFFGLASSHQQQQKGAMATTKSDGIGVKTTTRISVSDRGFALESLRKTKRKNDDDSISLDSDERQLNGAYVGPMGGISTETTVEVDERTLRDLEEGGDLGARAWEHDPDDRGYQVRILAGDAEGEDSIAADHHQTPIEPQHSGGLRKS